MAAESNRPYAFPFSTRIDVEKGIQEEFPLQEIICLKIPDSPQKELEESNKKRPTKLEFSNLYAICSPNNPDRMPRRPGFTLDAPTLEEIDRAFQKVSKKKTGEPDLPQERRKTEELLNEAIQKLDDTTNSYKESKENKEKAEEKEPVLVIPPPYCPTEERQTIDDKQTEKLQIEKVHVPLKVVATKDDWLDEDSSCLIRMAAD